MLSDGDWNDVNRPLVADDTPIMSYTTNIQHAKVATCWYFVSLGLVIGDFSAVMPKLQTKFKLSNALLGIVLISAIGGSIISAPIVSAMNQRYGTSFSSLIGGLSLILLFPILGIPGNNIGILICGIICLGFTAAIVDISLNGQAVLLEKVVKNSCLGLMHAFYAIGGMVGALYGGLMVQNNQSLSKNFIILSIVQLLPTLFASRFMFTYDEETAILKQADDENMKVCDEIGDEKSVVSATTCAITVSSNKTQYYQVLLIGCIGFIGFLGEGSIGDWSAIYLTFTLQASPLMSSLGIVFYQVFVAIVRYYSDHLLSIYSYQSLLLFSGFVGTIGLVIVVLASLFSSSIGIVVAILGFALTGVGIGMVSPIVISYAGSRITTMKQSDAIAIVSTASYIGILVGPPLIGGLSFLLGQLRWSLLVDAILMFFIAIGSVYLP